MAGEEVAEVELAFRLALVTVVDDLELLDRHQRGRGHGAERAAPLGDAPLAVSGPHDDVVGRPGQQVANLRLPETNEPRIRLVEDDLVELLVGADDPLEPRPEAIVSGPSRPFVFTDSVLKVPVRVDDFPWTSVAFTPIV